MTVLLDANVLIALVVADHVHHDAAERWYVARDETIASCPSTQGSLIRVLVRNGLDGSSAVAAATRLLDHDRHTFWADDLAYGQVRMTGVIGHRQVTDAYLAALARAHAARIATFDSGFVAMHPDVADTVPVS